MGKHSRPRSQRQLKVGEEVRHALSNVFMKGDFYDPNLRDVSLTVSEVRVSPDLKNATAYVMPLAGYNQEGVIEALSKAAYELRRVISSQLHLRTIPALYFKLDETFDEAERMNSLLQKPEVQRDLVTANEDE